MEQDESRVAGEMVRPVVVAATAMNSRQGLAGGVAAALELGVLVAVALEGDSALHAADRANSWFALVLVWSEDTRRHSPAGAWAVFAGLTALAAAIFAPATIGAARRWHHRRTVRWVPGLLCVTVPWLLWSVTAEVHISGARREDLAAIAGVALASVVVGAFGSWFSQAASRAVAVTAAIAALVCLGVCAMLAYIVHDPYAWPLTLTVTFGSCALFTAWLMDVRGIRELSSQGALASPSTHA